MLFSMHVVTMVVLFAINSVSVMLWSIFAVLFVVVWLHVGMLESNKAIFVLGDGL